MPAQPPHLSRRSVLRRAGALGVVLGGGSLLAACGGDDTGVTSGASPAAGGATPTPSPSAVASAAATGPRTIRTCVYARNHASSPLYWQQFAPEGITIEVNIVESASEVQQGLEAGDLDFGLMGYFNTVLALDTPEGINSRIVGMISRQGVGLIGSTAAGVASVADLAGKRIGVPPPGVQTLILSTLLAEAGLDLQADVEGIPLGYADHPTALAAGDIDAYVGTEPLCTQSIVDGTGQRLSEVYDTPVGDLNTAMWASPASLEDPDLVALATELQRQAGEFLTPGGSNDPEVWRELLVEQFEYEEAIYEAVLENVGAPWRFDDERAAQFAAAAELMLEQEIITTEVDVETLFAREYWLS